MSIETEVLIELYTIIKQYVPVKDRQECADNLMSVMVDMLGDSDLNEFGNADSVLKRALKEYLTDDEDEDKEEDDNY
jgi:hypothetical protein